MGRGIGIVGARDAEIEVKFYDQSNDILEKG